MSTIFAAAAGEMAQQNDCMLVTIIEKDGSAPRGAGAQMLVGGNGRLYGTIGGGETEYVAIEAARQLIMEKRSDTRIYGLHGGERTKTGAVCGGAITVRYQYIGAQDAAWAEVLSRAEKRIESGEKTLLVLYADGSTGSLYDEHGRKITGQESEKACGAPIEGYDRETGCFAMMLCTGERVILFGAGHCAAALAPLLQTVDFRVTVFDERRALSDAKRFPGAEHVICGDFSRIREELTITKADYVVIMTSGHADDLTVLRQVLEGEAAYVGVIGSRSKIAYTQSRLREWGIEEEKIRAVHAPIGLPIRSATPAEIAVSIAAEMILCRAEKREEQGKERRLCPMH